MMGKLSKKIFMFLSLVSFFFLGSSIVSAEDIQNSDSVLETCTLSFNVFEGTEINPVQGIPCGQEFDLSSYASEKNGFEFAGWYDTDGYDNKLNSVLVNGNVMVYAKWNEVKKSNQIDDLKDNDFKITYDLDGGLFTGDYPQSYNSETETFDLVNPVKEGYTFVGWSNEEGEDLGLKITISKGSTGDRKYKACYKINKYVVSFVDTDLSFLELEYNRVLSLNDYIPVKDGYVFVGWCDTSDYKNKISSLVVKDTTNVYAKWLKKVKVVVNYLNSSDSIISKNKELDLVEGDSYDESAISINGYVLNNNKLPVNNKGVIGDTDVVVNYYYNKLFKVSFNSNGGSNVKELDNVIENSNVKVSNINITKDGYVFAGWYNDDYSVKYELVNVKSDMVLYAKWLKKVKLIVNYVDDNNRVLNNQFVSDYIEGQSYSVNSIRIDGYKSVGENSYNGLFGINDIVVNFKYKRVYSLVFNSNGGSSVLSIRNNDYGTVIDLTRYTSSRYGYTFNGWYTDQALTNKISRISMNSDKIVYAKWSLVDYNVSYDLDGGEVANNPSTYTVLSETRTLNNPVKKGHTFIGWKDENGEDLGLVVMIFKGSTGNKKYSASYRINKYSVSFENCDLKSMSYDYNTHIRLDDFKPEKEEYLFDGWYKDEKLTIMVNEIDVNENIKLYAKWKMNLSNEVKNPETSDGMSLYIILLFFAAILVLGISIVQKYFFYE